jgi:hypothetical protein
VIFEAITKLLELLILSRCNIPSTPSDRSRFNLHLPSLPTIRTLMQSFPLTQPITLTFTFDGVAGGRIVLEQYYIKYDAAGAGDGKDILAVLRVVCKQVIILLRTVHSYMRLSFSHNLTKLPSPHTMRSNAKRFPPAIELLRGDRGKVSFSFSSDIIDNSPVQLQETGHDPHYSAAGSSPCQLYDGHTFSAIPTPYGVLNVSCLSINQKGFEAAVDRYLREENGEQPAQQTAAYAGNTNINFISDYTNNPDVNPDANIGGSSNGGSSSQSSTHSQFSSPQPTNPHHHHLQQQQQQQLPHTAPPAEYRRRHTLSQEQEMSGLARALANDVHFGQPPKQPQPQPQQHFGQQMYPPPNYQQQQLPPHPPAAQINNPHHTFAANVPPPPTLTRGYSRSLDHNGPSPLVQKMQGMNMAGPPPTALYPAQQSSGMAGSPTPPLHPGTMVHTPPDAGVNIFGYGYTDGFGNQIHQPQQQQFSSRPQSRTQSLSTSPLFAPSSPPFNFLSTSPNIGGQMGGRRNSNASSNSASNSATSSATTTPNIFGVPGDVSGFLLPPSALDTLQDSPFKNQQQQGAQQMSSHSVSGIHASLHPSPSPSTMFGSVSMTGAGGGLAGLLPEEGADEEEQEDQEASFLPFADVLESATENRNDSMMESASNFAKKCGNSQRLEMFGRVGEESSLDEFRKFAADSSKGK